MEAKELRLGNLILSKGLICEVEKVEHDGIVAQFKHTDIEMDNTRGIEGIPLTKEWLIKFGFVDDELHLDMNKETGCIDTIYFNDGKIGTSSSEYYGLHKIQYVHELQNLYFALTGKEL